MLIVGGILAVSGLIVAKKPDAKELIDKLVPYQAIIGIALLALGIVNLVRWLGNHVFTLLSVAPLFGLTVLAMIFTSILLGFMFGMPQIAKWLPGEGGAEQKGMELSKKLAPYQVIIGLIGLASALLMLLYRFSILKIG
ncbi:MAG TPA: hypothetical protein VFD36_03535 [Kofleriaceae bacterium]|nr:hypothetical protein [Kofleriaceae bacterium]